MTHLTRYDSINIASLFSCQNMQGEESVFCMNLLVLKAMNYGDQAGRQDTYYFILLYKKYKDSLLAIMITLSSTLLVFWICQCLSHCANTSIFSAV